MKVRRKQQICYLAWTCSDCNLFKIPLFEMYFCQSKISPAIERLSGFFSSVIYHKIKECNARLITENKPKGD